MHHLRENVITKCCEYIGVYQDDLYIASPTPEAILNSLENKLNINPDFILELNIQMIQVG